PQGEPRPGRAGRSRMQTGSPDRVGRERGPRLGLGDDHGRLAAGSDRADDGLRSHARRVPSADGIRAITRGASARKRHRTLPAGWPPADGPGRASRVAGIRHRSFTHHVRTSHRQARASAHARLKQRKPPSIRTVFPFATITAARVNKAAEPHSRVTKRIRTYNHLAGGRHGAFASKPARSSPRRLTALSDLVGTGRTKTRI